MFSKQRDIRLTCPHDQPGDRTIRSRRFSCPDGASQFTMDAATEHRVRCFVFRYRSISSYAGRRGEHLAVCSREIRRIALPDALRTTRSLCRWGRRATAFGETNCNSFSVITGWRSCLRTQTILIVHPDWRSIVIFFYGFATIRLIGMCYLARCHVGFATASKNRSAMKIVLASDEGYTPFQSIHRQLAYPMMTFAKCSTPFKVAL